MSPRRLLVPLAVLLLLGPGCGGDSGGGKGGGTAPSGFLTITVPQDVAKVGTSQTCTATYTTGGAPQTVTPTWRTDNTAVATIDAAGKLTAVAHGEVTVIAEHQGAVGTKKIQVVNDYGVMWLGNYVVTRCEATGDFDPRDWCGRELFAPGETLPLGLDLQQDRYSVTGTLWLGGLNGSFAGSVASGGHLTGESKFTVTFEGGSVDILVSPFSVLREGDRITQGTFKVLFTIPGATGNCNFDARILGLDQATSGRAGLRLVPRMPRTMRDVPRLMRQM